MLKKILSISGKPGLFKLISYGKNLIVVENVIDHKRNPAYTHDKIISLGDIAIYTDSEEIPLGDVFDTIYKKFEGKTVDPKAYKTPEDLVKFFSEILPNFDRDRVYNNDIKKIISWYNILVNANLTEFKAVEKSETEDKE